jgi:hypothetical protein
VNEVADQEDVRRIALSLPGASEAKGLPAVTKAQLGKLIADAWRCQAPPELLEAETAPARARRQPRRRGRGAGGGPAQGRA